MTIGLIYARGTNHAFGNQGRLPWNIPEDLAFFQKITQGHTVIMGRKTWDSLPSSKRPLPNRINIVITREKRQSNPSAGLYFVRNIRDAVFTSRACKSRQTWVIGGPGIIKSAEPWAEVAVVTSITYSGAFDVSAPQLTGKAWNLESIRFPRDYKQGNPMYHFQLWRPARVMEGGATYE